MGDRGPLEEKNLVGSYACIRIIGGGRGAAKGEDAGGGGDAWNYKYRSKEGEAHVDK